MAKIVVINHLTLDGVMQSPGRSEEDTRGGFTHGGWGSQNSDEEMLGYWNTQDSPFNEGLNNAPKYVGSRTLREPLSWPNSTLLKAEAGDAVAELKQRAPGDLFVMGSGELIETLMRRELIDEYLLVIHPLVLGTGRRMFADGAPPTALRLVDNQTTAKGVVIATYRALGNKL